MPPRPRLRAAIECVLIAGVLASAPLVWRVALRRWGPPQTAQPPNYLPVLEAERSRHAFEPSSIEWLQGIDPKYVIVGDSMAGRIDVRHLEEITSSRAAPILQNATGSVYWYLAFKNWIVASGVRPSWVIVFFRDTNLTDPLFRIGDPDYVHLDEVALDREDELNAVLARRVDPWFRVHHAVSRLYDVDPARAWLEPKLPAWAEAEAVPNRRLRETFRARLNDMFSLEHLRTMAAADMAAVEDRDTDFDASVSSSVLPLFVQLARARDLHLCFVRVLRRTENGQPPPESPAMTRYVQRLRGYLESHGAVLRDDRDDPVMATIEYADGDHIGRGERVRYTDRFVATTPIFK
jgi:hypothetical protein